MPDHPQRFRIVGFCDVPVKPAKDGTTRFAPEHQFFADHLPTDAVLMDFSKRLGYYPGTHAGMTHREGLCQPVYETVGEGTDYVNCVECFPARAHA